MKDSDHLSKYFQSNWRLSICQNFPLSKFCTIRYLIAPGGHKFWNFDKAWIYLWLYWFQNHRITWFFCCWSLSETTLQLQIICESLLYCESCHSTTFKFASFACHDDLTAKHSYFRYSRPPDVNVNKSFDKHDHATKH